MQTRPVKKASEGVAFIWGLVRGRAWLTGLELIGLLFQIFPSKKSCCIANRAEHHGFSLCSCKAGVSIVLSYFALTILHGYYDVHIIRLRKVHFPV